MKNKKNLFALISIIIALIIVGVIWYVALNPKEEEIDVDLPTVENELQDNTEPDVKDTNEVTPEETSSSEPNTVPIKNELNPLEKISKLDYKILRSEAVTNKDTKEITYLFDILISTQILDDQLIALGKDVFFIVDDANEIKYLKFNIFTSEDAFTTTLSDSYKSEPISGLYARFDLVNKFNKKEVKYSKYFEVSDINKNMSNGYEFVKADKSEKSITAHVIIAEEVKENVINDLQNFDTVLKTENDGIDTVIIKTYKTIEDFEDGILIYEYNSLAPNFITAPTLLTY